MFRDFLSKNSRSLLLISILLFGWLAVFMFKGDGTAELVAHPTVGTIYIFQEDEVYAPMRIDSISEEQLFMRNYLFLFTDAIPKQAQILNDEFDLNFYAIYEKGEIQRLFKEGNLVKAYR